MDRGVIPKKGNDGGEGHFSNAEVGEGEVIMDYKLFPVE